MSLLTAFSVAMDTRPSVTFSVDCDCNNKAAAPATWGQAMDVPLLDVTALLLETPADLMLTPGAKMSMQLPQLLKLALASLLDVAATVMADGANAGEYWHASAFELPAATTTVTPASVARSIAVPTKLCVPRPPKLALMTAGRRPFCTIQSTARVHQENCPPPLLLRVLTPWIVTPLATPYWVPPTVPAQCVPCPCTSSEQSVEPS